jgi:LmbE family N-acetylglucosaminyl deacetylase
VKAGASVKAVLMTNGDGFRVAAERALKKLVVTPDNYVKFAYIRQKETLEALSLFGVSSRSVYFLGYPDRGLARMWADNWDPHNLFTSYYTKRTCSPYRNSYTRNAKHCGESVMADLESILKREKPTTIFIPHPSDAHPDHYATYCFVMAALEQLKSEGEPFIKDIKIKTYLVHRGDWPVPKGYQPKLRLSPPFSLMKAGTTWEARLLDPETVVLKKKAIQAHKTQVAVMKSFLMSFARSNELVGNIKTQSIPHVNDGRMAIDGRGTDWEHIPPCMQDPTGDNLLRDFYKAADVGTVYLCTDTNRLYARVDLVRNVSRRITYRMRVRGIGMDTEDDARVVQIVPGKLTNPQHLMYAWRNRTLEFSMPLDKLSHARQLFVAVETAGMGASIDRTGWRALDLNHPARQKALKTAKRQ